MDTVDIKTVDIKTVDTYKFLELALNDKVSPKEVASYIIERGPNSNLNCSYINKRYNDMPAVETSCSNAIIVYMINHKDIVSSDNFKEKIKSLDTKILMNIISYFSQENNYIECFDVAVKALFETRHVSMDNFINIFKDTFIGCESLEAFYKRFDFMTDMYSVWHYAPDRNHKFLIKDGKLMFYLYTYFSKYLGKITDDCYEAVDKDNTGLIYAYKRVTTDYTSFYDPNQKYIVGETYECNSDGDPMNDNSFGLNCWHKAGVKEYAGGGHYLKVIVNINDITYCNLLNGNLRCSKFIVTEETDLNEC